MSVQITFGGIPVPKGWKLWNNQSRPDPGRWFHELRYHHSGQWKLTLDFRPLDGAFPSFWMPPFAWKYAGDIEAVQKVFDTHSNSPDEVMQSVAKMLNVHPTNIGAMKLAILEYGEKWKKKKKLLFGAAEGAGLQEAKIDADWLAAEWDFNQPMTEETIKGELVKLIAQSAKKLGLPPDTGAKVKGFPFPDGYQLVLIDWKMYPMSDKQKNLPVKLEIVGAIWNYEYEWWQWDLKLAYQSPHGKEAVVVGGVCSKPMPEAGLPQLECKGVNIMKMNKQVIELSFNLTVNGMALGTWPAVFPAKEFPQLFPPLGKIEGKPYWIPNT